MHINDPKTPRVSTRKVTKAKKAKKTTVLTETQDSFTVDTQQQQERHLRMEHLAQMRAADRLHTAKIQALWADLHTQMLKLWNDVWLQRQKTQDEFFKAWSKVLLS